MDVKEVYLYLSLETNTRGQTFTKVDEKTALYESPPSLLPWTYKELVLAEEEETKTMDKIKNADGTELINFLSILLDDNKLFNSYYESDTYVARGHWTHYSSNESYSLELTGSPSIVFIFETNGEDSIYDKQCYYGVLFPKLGVGYSKKMHGFSDTNSMYKLAVTQKENTITWTGSGTAVSILMGNPWYETTYRYVALG